MLDAAGRRLPTRPELGARVQLREAGIDTLSSDGERFDAVCCHGC
ncbi:hypothetical protein ACFV9D_27340 [Streptomyces sp. NPDC059875]